MIDTKRLATDAAYWLECGAPEDATHALDTEKRLHWEKWEDGIIWVYRPGGWAKHNKITAALFERIPRPQAPEAEWVDGLPPIGWHGECTWGTKVDWCECVMLPYKWAAVNMSQRGQGWELRPIDGYEFRQLKPKAQRDREELVDIVCGQGFLSKDGNVSWEIADAIIAAGWRKE